MQLSWAQTLASGQPPGRRAQPGEEESTGLRATHPHPLPQRRQDSHLDVLVGWGPARALLRFSGFPLKFDFTETSFGFLQC